MPGYTEADYENSIIELFQNDLGYEHIYGPDIERDFHSPLYEEALLDALYLSLIHISQLFYSVTIPVTLWFITKNKKQKGKTLFIDARKMGYMVDRKHRDFTDEDIEKLADTFTAFQEGTLEDVKGFCAVADLKEIEKQDFISVSYTHLEH